jgi:GT2 family glycosyltransferase
MTAHPIASDVSVVIPTIGRPLLEGCLESIAAGTEWPATLIVVDQGSSSAVDSWVDRMRGNGMAIDHLRSNQTGISAATNRGFERVRTPFVAVTHDDCRARPDWLETLSIKVRSAGDSIITGRVEPEGPGLVLTIVTHRDRALYSKPLIDRDVLFPANMAFPIRLLDRVGLFDEHPSFRLAGEDNDWAYRALTAGVPIVYHPDVVVAHLAWHDPRERASLSRRYARGQGSFYGKHLRRGDRFILRRALRDLARAPWLVVRGALSRNRDLLAMGLGELGGLPAGIVSGLRNRGELEPPLHPPVA